MIPVARPSLGEAEAAAARDVILSGWVTQGPKVQKFEEDFAAFIGTKHACAVSSCTTSLHLALLAVGVRPGDVVITVSHSFIATANSVRLCGAEPVFVDINPDTYNMEPAALEQCLTRDCARSDGVLFYTGVARLAVGESPLPRGVDAHRSGRVAAVLAVHQMGMPCDLDAILSIARAVGLPVVEDAACAIGSEVRLPGRPGWEAVGKPHGDVACFSFHPRKVVTTGDGGMLTTDDADMDRRFRLLRQHGMSVSDIARHGARKVEFEEYLSTGYNYRMTDIQAAVGIEQLRRLPGFIAERRALADAYLAGLGGVSWLGLPCEPAYARTNWQSYPVRVLKGAPVGRDGLMQRLLDAGISTRRGIMNAHQERPYQMTEWRLPHSEAARDEVILLPLFSEMSPEQLQRVVATVRNG